MDQRRMRARVLMSWWDLGDRVVITRAGIESGAVVAEKPGYLGDAPLWLTGDDGKRIEVTTEKLVTEEFRIRMERPMGRKRAEPPTRDEIYERLQVVEITTSDAGAATIAVLDPATEWCGYLVQKDRGPADVIVCNLRGQYGRPIHGPFGPLELLKSSLVFQVYTRATVGASCSHRKRSQARNCRCGDYTACCDKDLDEHVAAAALLDDGKDHG